MAKKHGARQQKKLAKHKAKRMQKCAILDRTSSKDPTLRFQGVAKWPVLKSLVSAELWEDGIGYLALARQDAGGMLVFAVYLVDVLCLGVKDAFWRAGAEDFEDTISHMNEKQEMIPIAPACLVKIVRGGVDFAQSFGFPPHPDYRHAARLLEGIDPAGCTQEFTFGRDGRPFYINGPFETPAEVMAIAQRVRDAGGHFLAMGPPVLEGDETRFPRR